MVQMIRQAVSGTPSLGVLLHQTLAQNSTAKRWNCTTQLQSTTGNHTYGRHGKNAGWLMTP